VFSIYNPKEKKRNDIYSYHFVVSLPNLPKESWGILMGNQHVSIKKVESVFNL
jgi:hypothetical protein